MAKQPLVQHKPTLGFQVTALGDGYARMVLPGVLSMAREKNMNLIIFPGNSLNAPRGFDYQHNIIYEYLNPSNVNAIIMASGTLSSFIDRETFKSFYTKHLTVPIVSMSVKIDNMPSVLVDNRSGMNEAIRHLIQDHHCRKIAFIKGPENNSEAEVRYQTYLDVLETNKIEQNPTLVYQGDFTRLSGVEAVYAFLDTRRALFDAVIAANDEMAMGVMEALHHRGMIVPRDVAVIGFDNIEMAQFHDIPLSTVAQPLYEQARTAAGIAAAMIEKQEYPETVILPTRLIRRASCGCFSHSIELIDIKTQPDHDRNRLSRTSVEKFIEEIINEIMDTGDIKPTGIVKRKSIIQKLLVPFFDKALSEEFSSAFLSSLDETLHEEMREGQDISFWQDAVTVIIKHLGSHFSSNGEVKLLEKLWQKCRVLIGETLRREQARKRLEIQEDNGKLREVIQQLISTLYIDQMIEVIKNELPRLDIKSCAISSYPEEVIHLRNQVWSKPAKNKLLMVYDENGQVTLSNDESRLYGSEYLVPPDYLPRERRYAMVAYSLFFREEQFGIMLMEIGSKDLSLYESLSLEIGSAIKGSLLFTERVKAEEKMREILLELEKYNQKISSLSQTDELTGLYNRRGFLNLGQHGLSFAYKMKKNGLIFFARLENLEQINVMYGQKQGDYALGATAEILKKTFRNMDILARIGGDEFVIFAVDTKLDFIEVLRKRMDSLTEKFNSKDERPYKIYISLGAVSFDYNQKTNIKKLMQEIDFLLYEEKKQKHISRLD